MLVLSRRVDESIMIGDDIKITLLDIRNGNSARIGISAPRHVAVHREEVYEEIEALRRNARLAERSALAEKLPAPDRGVYGYPELDPGGGL